MWKYVACIFIRIVDNGSEVVEILERNSEFLVENVSQLDNLLEIYEAGQRTCVHAAIM